MFPTDPNEYNTASAAFEHALYNRPSKLNVLDGELAVVTGAASGVGKGSVERFHDAGATVLGLDWAPVTDKDKIPGVHYFQGSVAEAAGYTDLLAHLQTIGKPVDLVVCAAGTTGRIGNALKESMDDFTSDDFDNVMAVNAKGPMLTMKLLEPYLNTVDRPSAFVTGSVLAHPDLWTAMPAYAASKAALDPLLANMRRAIPMLDVFLMVLQTVDTPMVKANQAAQDYAKRYSDRGRMTTVDEVVNAMINVHLNRPEGRHIDCSEGSVEKCLAALAWMAQQAAATKA